MAAVIRGHSTTKIVSSVNPLGAWQISSWWQYAMSDVQEQQAIEQVKSPTGAVHQCTVGGMGQCLRSHRPSGKWTVYFLSGSPAEKKHGAGSFSTIFGKRLGRQVHGCLHVSLAGAD